jgi:hypothetical protein
MKWKARLHAEVLSRLRVHELEYDERDLRVKMRL